MERLLRELVKQPMPDAEAIRRAIFAGLRLDPAADGEGGDDDGEVGLDGLAPVSSRQFTQRSADSAAG